MAIFKGAAVAIVTPFFDNGEINYPKLAELLTRSLHAALPVSLLP